MTTQRSALAALLVFGWLAPTPAAAQAWLTFTEVSSTRIVTNEGDPDSVGLTDPFEKDLATGDVDRDGDTDLVIVRKVRFSTAGGKKNVLYLNEAGVMTDRTATFVPGFADLTDDRDVALADLTGDGWLDIVTVTTFSDQPRLYRNLGDDVNGDWQGFLYEPARLPTFVPGPKFCAVAVGDIDNDGDLDLFFVDYSNTLEDRLLINNGSGTFADETASRMTAAMSASAFGTDAQIVDMNGDGAREIIKVNTLSATPNSVRILYNDPANLGHFNFMQIAYTESPYMMEIADLDLNGRPDIYVVDDAQDRFLLNTGNDAQGHALFSENLVTSSPVTNTFGGNLYLFDFNRDGLLDPLVADVDTDFQICDNQPAVLRTAFQAGNLTITDPLNGVQPAFMPTGTFDFALLDVDRDGEMDLWAGTCTGNRLFLGGAVNQIFSNGFESGDTSGWTVTAP